MDQDAQALLDRIKADQKATSDRMHRDARRQHTLKSASLMFGTGKSAAEVETWLAQQHLTLVTRMTNAVQRFDSYGRGK